MRVRFLVIIIFIIAACKKDKLPKDQVILGHAGAGTDFINANKVPNTSSSIEQALLIYGLDGVELDLQFSNDIKGFIYHDRALEEQTTLNGEIYKMSSSELQDGKWLMAKDEDLLGLEETLELLSTKYFPAKVSLNIKNYDPDPDYSGIAAYLKELLDKHTMKVSAYVESDNIRLLDSIKSIDSEISCLFNGVINRENYELVVNRSYDGLVDHHQDAEIEYMDSLRAKNKLSVIYGQLIQSDFQSETTLRADIIQVDNPVLAIKSK